MMSEMASSYRRMNAVSRDNRRLQDQVCRSMAERLSAEASHAQQIAQLRESADGFLAAQLAAEEKLLAAEEEVKLLKEQLFRSQDALATHMEGERLAMEAKDRAECEFEDLRHQQASQDVILNDMKAVLEVEVVDRLKRSPTYDALLLHEFERGMQQAKKFFALKDHYNEKALKRYDRNLQRHMDGAVRSVKN